MMDKNSKINRVDPDITVEYSRALDMLNKTAAERDAAIASAEAAEACVKELEEKVKILELQKYSRFTAGEVAGWLNDHPTKPRKDAIIRLTKQRATQTIKTPSTFSDNTCLFTDSPIHPISSPFAVDSRPIHLFPSGPCQYKTTFSNLM